MKILFDLRIFIEILLSFLGWGLNTAFALTHVDVSISTTIISLYSMSNVFQNYYLDGVAGFQKIHLGNYKHLPPPHCPYPLQEDRGSHCPRSQILSATLSYGTNVFPSMVCRSLVPWSFMMTKSQKATRR